MICKDIDEVLYHLEGFKYHQVVATSGGFDPVHFGHVRCILATSLVRPPQKTVIIVNSDEFLIRKKGFAFMPLDERMEIIDAIKGVDYVVPWEDGTQFVSGALAQLEPDYFTKGGDRSSPDQVPELDVCKRIDCQIIFGVGGTDKIQSSSSLVKGK
jgi:D-beta-D-heptose 7-phosphate kinase/D-beta-D-heptose 1-phosphate adenosyltransferase